MSENVTQLRYGSGRACKEPWAEREKAYPYRVNVKAKAKETSHSLSLLLGVGIPIQIKVVLFSFTPIGPEAIKEATLLSLVWVYPYAHHFRSV